MHSIVCGAGGRREAGTRAYAHVAARGIIRVLEVDNLALGGCHATEVDLFLSQSAIRGSNYFLRLIQFLESK